MGAADRDLGGLLGRVFPRRPPTARIQTWVAWNHTARAGSRREGRARWTGQDWLEAGSGDISQTGATLREEERLRDSLGRSARELVPFRFEFVFQQENAAQEARSGRRSGCGVPSARWPQGPPRRAGSPANRTSIPKRGTVLRPPPSSRGNGRSDPFEAGDLRWSPLSTVYYPFNCHQILTLPDGAGTRLGANTV